VSEKLIGSCHARNTTVQLLDSYAERHNTDGKTERQTNGQIHIMMPIADATPTATPIPQTPVPKNFQRSTIGYFSNSWAGLLD